MAAHVLKINKIPGNFERIAPELRQICLVYIHRSLFKSAHYDIRKGWLCSADTDLPQREA
jgi:hypothetical protein